MAFTQPSIRNPGVGSSGGFLNTQSQAAGFSNKFSDFFRGMTPEAKMGLLQAGLGILASPSYGNTGAQIGKGGLIGTQGYDQARRTGILSDQQKTMQNYYESQISAKELERQAAIRAAEAQRQNRAGWMSSDVASAISPSANTPDMVGLTYPEGLPVPQAQGEPPTLTGPKAFNTPYSPENQSMVQGLMDYQNGQQPAPQQPAQQQPVEPSKGYIDDAQQRLKPSDEDAAIARVEKWRKAKLASAADDLEFSKFAGEQQKNAQAELTALRGSGKNLQIETIPTGEMQNGKALYQNYYIPGSINEDGSPVMIPIGKPAPQGALTEVNVNAGEKSRDVGIGTGVAKRYNDYINAGVAAQQQAHKYEQISNIIDELGPLGRLTNLGTEAAAYVEKLFGITLDPDLGKKEALRGLMKELALELRNPANGAGMPGALSDPDREFLEQATGKLDFTKEGFLRLLNIRKKFAARAQEIAELAVQYNQRPGGFDDNFSTFLKDYYKDKHIFKPRYKQSDAPPPRS